MKERVVILIYLDSLKIDGSETFKFLILFYISICKTDDHKRKILPSNGKDYEDNRFLICFVNFFSNHWEEFHAVDCTNAYDDINDFCKDSC